MTDIDLALARLREMPVHPGLSSIDDKVLECVAIRSAGAHPSSGTVFGIAAIAALSMGIGSSVLPGMLGSAASAAPFGSPPALAPSSLLGNDQ